LNINAIIKRKNILSEKKNYKTSLSPCNDAKKTRLLNIGTEDHLFSNYYKVTPIKLLIKPFPLQSDFFHPLFLKKFSFLTCSRKRPGILYSPIINNIYLLLISSHSSLGKSFKCVFLKRMEVLAVNIKLSNRS